MVGRAAFKTSSEFTLSLAGAHLKNCHRFALRLDVDRFTANSSRIRIKIKIRRKSRGAVSLCAPLAVDWRLDRSEVSALILYLGNRNFDAEGSSAAWMGFDREGAA